MKFRNENVQFQMRGLATISLGIIVFAFLLINIANLEIVDGAKYYLIASRTNQSKVTQVAPRGIIFDSTGKKVAYNTMSYSVYIKTDMLTGEKEDELFEKLATYLKRTKQELADLYKLKAYDENGAKQSGLRVTVASNVAYEEYINLLAYEVDLKNYGVFINSEPIRYYEFPNSLSNVIGYVGDPNAEDVKNGIYPESTVGREGLERFYDTYLRGKEGLQIFEKDPLSGQSKKYTTQEAEAGSSINLTIDGRWQATLYTALKNRAAEVNAFAGAGVIINSKTGEVKAMATFPGYNNNTFTQGISYTEYQGLINDPRQPLFNRPIALQLPPGSTWKVFAATAGLEGQAITEDTVFFSNRCMDLPGDIKFCEADKGYMGEVDLMKAFAASSNIYFCNTAIALNTKYGGPSYLLDTAGTFGLGKKTGIDLYGEANGTLPSPELKWQIYHEPWYIGDDCNTVVGQGLVTVTPLQMAVATAAIVNGGNVMKPYIVSSIMDQDGNITKEFMPEVRGEVEASQATLDIVQKGMRGAVTNGTASALKDLPGEAIGKTGSSDASEVINGKRYTGAHSWVIGCFDYQEENYCFAVILQYGGRGFKSVTVMKNFISCLYNNFTGYCIN